MKNKRVVIPGGKWSDRTRALAKELLDKGASSLNHQIHKGRGFRKCQKISSNFF